MDWLSSAWNILVRGGPVMVPLMACSVISLAVILERGMAIRTAIEHKGELFNTIEHFLCNGKADRALEVCEAEGGPVASMLAEGISNRHLGPQGAERAMIDKASRETDGLTARLWLLDTIITIAPLLGLLGTVVGMIRSFHVISTREGIGTPTAITGGVAEALIATGTGLAIAIVTLIFYNALNEKVKKVTGLMESTGTRLINILSEIEEQGDEVKLLSA